MLCELVSSVQRGEMTPGRFSVYVTSYHFNNHRLDYLIIKNRRVSGRAAARARMSLPTWQLKAYSGMHTAHRLKNVLQTAELQRALRGRYGGHKAKAHRRCSTSWRRAAAAERWRSRSAAAGAVASATLAASAASSPSSHRCRASMRSRSSSKCSALLAAASSAAA